MEHAVHPLQELFDQLGLPSDPTAIAQFIRRHAPLAAATSLADAPFWTPAQAAFLREKVLDDADWAEIVDQLNVALRE